MGWCGDPGTSTSPHWSSLHSRTNHHRHISVNRLYPTTARSGPRNSRGFSARSRSYLVQTAGTSWPFRSSPLWWWDLLPEKTKYSSRMRPARLSTICVSVATTSRYQMSVPGSGRGRGGDVGLQGNKFEQSPVMATSCQVAGTKDCSGSCLQPVRLQGTESEADLRLFLCAGCVFRK